MESFFKGSIVQHIERAKNTEADELAKAAARKAALPPYVFFQIIEDPFVKTVELEPRMINVVQGEDWRAPSQNFLPNTQAPSQPTQLITPSWPLQRWGIDIVGPLTTAQENYKYVVVEVKYFTKWIDVEPLVNIAAVGLKRFF
jgi:hypothetical protein